MLKYKNTVVTFAEVPSEVALCINITGCPIKCPACHSKWLWEDIGEPLNEESLKYLIEKNQGITCVAFMGGDNSPNDIYNLAKWVRDNTSLKVCWYSGSSLRTDIPLSDFNFIKTGPYKEELGGLDSITTNQRFYKVTEKRTLDNKKVLFYYLKDITDKFQKR